MQIYVRKPPFQHDIMTFQESAKEIVQESLIYIKHK